MQSQDIGVLNSKCALSAVHSIDFCSAAYLWFSRISQQFDYKSREDDRHTEKSFNFFLAARNKRSRTHVISAILQRGGSCSRFAAGSVPIWFPSQGKGPGPQRRSPLLISCQSMRPLSTPAPSVKPAKNSSISPPEGLRWHGKGSGVASSSFCSPFYLLRNLFI